MTNFYYNRAAKEILAEFRSDAERGLSSHEAAARQKTYGKNILKVKEISLLKRILEPFVDIFMLILVVALGLSLAQGDYLESVAIGAIIVADAAIYYIQQFSTERILRALRESTRQTVAVLRDGAEQALLSEELVPGDIVILREGDRIPADGRIVHEAGLLSDEAMLTGESEPIAKDAKAISGLKKVYEQRNMVFSGAFVLTGTGKFVVTATGNATEYGRIASLASSVEETSPIADKINRLVFQIAIAVVAAAALALTLQILDGIEIFSALKFTLAMIVSAVPEGLPIAISIVLALCAKRMARQQALIRELKAIESIGIVTTIASDKTGTLTENRLELRETWGYESKAKLETALARATLQTLANVDADSNANLVAADPLDVCLGQYLATQKVNHHLEPVRSYAFDQSLKMSGNLYRANGKLLLAVKGAPEIIMAHAKLTAAEHDKIEAKLTEFTSLGLKVIALAEGHIAHEINELGRLEKSTKLEFAGLIAIADAIRPEAARAIKQNSRMGVKTKMVTGDHAGTAYAIGRELGLAQDFSEVLDCSKLGNISDEDLEDLVRKTTVFARVTPEDKFRILDAIKQTEICAMTGDGVNDVPALVGAHVGIAMGDSPSIVQDAGDIVLLDNNFKNITAAIRESRTVLANIRRMLSYLLATNAGEALTILGALALFGQQLLTPIQVLWINLVTDSLLVIPLGLEPPEAAVLRAKPERKDAAILPGFMVVRMLILAGLMAVVTIATFAVAETVLGSAEQAHTLAFTALAVMQWSGALTARGIHENIWQRLKVRHAGFFGALVAAILLQALALFGPLAAATGTVAVPLAALAITAIIAFGVPLIVMEIAKRIMLFDEL